MNINNDMPGRPLPQSYFGATGARVRFHDGSSVVNGYIVRQLGTYQFIVTTDGITTYVARLAQDAATARVPTAGFFAIDVNTPAGVSFAKSITKNRITTTAGDVYLWSLGAASAADAKVNLTGDSALSVPAAPTITSSASVSVASLAALTHTLTSNQTVRWSVIGGVDAFNFALAGSTISWLSSTGPNSSNPEDTDKNNTYLIQVQATNTVTGLSTTQTITVTVVAPVFAVADNNVTAYSTFPSPPSEASLAKFVVAYRAKMDVVGLNHRVSGTSGNPWGVGTAGSSGWNIIVGSTAIANARTNMVTDALMRTIIWTVDFTKPDITTGMKCVIDGVAQTFAAGTFDSLSSTRTLNIQTLFGNGASVGLFADQLGANIMDGRMEFFYMDWGTVAYTLPDITDPTVYNKFTFTGLTANGSGPTGAQPKLYYTGSAAEWNAGMANKGSLTAPLTKQAGTYI